VPGRRPIGADYRGTLSPSDAADRAAELHSHHPGRRGPARPADAAKQGAAAELVENPRRYGASGDRRDPPGGCGPSWPGSADFRRFANARQLVSACAVGHSFGAQGGAVASTLPEQPTATVLAALGGFLRPAAECRVCGDRLLTELGSAY
jgi:hypothetical protein